MLFELNFKMLLFCSFLAILVHCCAVSDKFVTTVANDSPLESNILNLHFQIGMAKVSNDTQMMVDFKYEPGSIVHSGRVTVRQIDAPVQPIVIYRKFRNQNTDNRQNNLLKLLNIDNWVNATTQNNSQQQFRA